MPSRGLPIENLARAMRSAYPELDAIVAVAADPVFLIGGAVRDLLLGRPRADVDIVVVGDAAALASDLGGAGLSEHARFATAKVELDGHEIDIASARRESYPRPGALPVVEPADGIEADLGRRDFTINAMAVPLGGEARLIDPHRGRTDLEQGLLRVLHERSFEDDPTRAIRAARYASRFGFELESKTEGLLRAANLTTVSADRRQAELIRLAAESTAPRGFELLAEWGLVELRGGGVDLATAVCQLLETKPWGDLVPRAPAVLAAALDPVGGEAELVTGEPERPSRGVELARGHAPIELVLARAQGAEWLDTYLREWRSVALEIDGDDLIEAGVAPGPALGRGLRAALRRRLDGEIRGRDEELAAALEAARGE